jgi:hypothetical protein
MFLFPESLLILLIASILPGTDSDGGAAGRVGDLAFPYSLVKHLQFRTYIDG